MSYDSLAAFRRHAGDDMARLAEQHLQHDLSEDDRDTLQRAARKFGLHTTIGSLVGVSFGVFLAVRVRNARKQWFEAIKAAEKPTHVQFANGRTEPLPDLTHILQPSPLGDIAAYILFSAGGLFIGGETGMLTGQYAAQRTLIADKERQKRIENAFRKFRADAFRKEAERLDKQSSLGIIDSAKSVAGWQ